MNRKYSLVFKILTSLLPLLISAQLANETVTHMTCTVPYCSNTTTLNFDSNNCPNPQISISFILTDFADLDSQYIAVSVDDQRLGYCAGPLQYANVTSERDHSAGIYSLHDNYTCVLNYSVWEITGANPDSFAVELHLSGRVGSNPYNGNLLDAQLTTTCDDTVPTETSLVQFNNIRWADVAPERVQCSLSGCDRTIIYNIYNNTHCTVPLLSVSLYITDYDQTFEYLSVNVLETQSGNYHTLGICEVGSNNQSVGIYDCFEWLDISDYTGFNPHNVTINLEISGTVDINWLDRGQTSFLLDAVSTLECDSFTQDDLYVESVTFNTTSEADVGTNLIFCGETECVGSFEFEIFGECPYPKISVLYNSNNMESNMIDLSVGDADLGHCGPFDSVDDLVFEEYKSSETVSYSLVSCISDVEVSDLITKTANRAVIPITFELANVGELDGIVAGEVAIILFTAACFSTTDQSTYNEVSFNPVRESSVDMEFRCPYAGCSSTTIVQVTDQAESCPIPALSISFWLTDFQLETEFLWVEINGKRFGLCDGGADGDLEEIYNCLTKADISQWVVSNTDFTTGDVTTEIAISLTISSAVDSLDSTYNSFLLSAVGTLECLEHSQRIVEIDFNAACCTRAAQPYINIPLLCTGAGCNATATVAVINAECKLPTLSVAFWLSDFLTFEEYVDVFINGQSMYDATNVRCYGGDDSYFGEIHTCFEDINIGSYLTEYSYNSDTDTDLNYINNDTLTISLSTTPDSDWLDHAYNRTLLDSVITIKCLSIRDWNETEMNETEFKVIQVYVTIEQVEGDLVRSDKEILLDRFEYSLNWVAHQNGDKDVYSYRLLGGDIDVIHVSWRTDLQLWIETDSQSDATALRTLIESDLFILFYAETLRDTSFANAHIESIHDVTLLHKVPTTPAPTPAPTGSPTTGKPTHSPTETITTTENVRVEEVIISKTKSSWAGDVGTTNALLFMGIFCMIVMACCCMWGLCYLGFVAAPRFRREREYKQQGDDDLSDLSGDSNQELGVAEQFEHAEKIEAAKTERRKSVSQSGRRHSRDLRRQSVSHSHSRRDRRDSRSRRHSYAGHHTAGHHSSGHHSSGHKRERRQSHSHSHRDKERRHSRSHSDTHGRRRSRRLHSYSGGQPQQQYYVEGIPTADFLQYGTGQPMQPQTGVYPPTTVVDPYTGVASSSLQSQADAQMIEMQRQQAAMAMQQRPTSHSRSASLGNVGNPMDNPGFAALVARGSLRQLSTDQQSISATQSQPGAQRPQPQRRSSIPAILGGDRSDNRSAEKRPTEDDAEMQQLVARATHLAENDSEDSNVSDLSGDDSPIVKDDKEDSLAF